MAARKKSPKTRANPTAALVRRLSRHASETISDVLDVMGLPEQTLSAAIKPITPGQRVIGPAFCVRGQAIDAAHPPATRQYDVDRQLTPGCVVVMSSGGYSGSALIGGNIAAAYRKRGCVGLVLSGAVRDPQEVKSFLPTFATHVTPRRPGGRWNVVAFDEPIALPGQGSSDVIVHPGDLVLGDASGVVVIPQAIAGTVLDAADKLVPLEKKVLADIKRGRDREQALKAHNRYGHIKRVVP
jgi:4-hydroxy-4-methyl-2-oxoglutarate aldolase